MLPLIFPYRVKNPWKAFPIATISIISLNVIIYILTSLSNYCLAADFDLIEPYCFEMGKSNVFTIFSAMFLHADILHIAGNMLFLWVFSPPIEDRLGIPRYLAVYFATGTVGSLLQGTIDLMAADKTLPGLGASGAVMGIMGAYWFIFSWSTVCVAYFIWLFYFIFRGVWQVKAFWVIGIYIALDLVQGILAEKGAGGVANFAHVGGGAAGIALCLAMRVRRDSAQVSEAKATQAETKDLNLLSLSDLEIMRAAEPQRTDIIRAMVPQALRMGRADLVRRCFAEAGPELMSVDPVLVTYYLVNLQGDSTIYKPAHIIRLARWAEADANPRNAIALYEIMLNQYNNNPAIELVLYRMALLYWEKGQDRDSAWALLHQQLERFPYGSLEQPAKKLLAQLK